MTKSQLLKLCRQQWPGHEIDLREHKAAAMGGERLKLREERARLRLRKDELRHLMTTECIRSTLESLIRAAQFVVDVNGDPTAVAKLAEALECAKTQEELRDEWQDAHDQLSHSDASSLASKLIVQRCEGWHRERGGLGWHSIGGGDSWDDVAEKAGLVHDSRRSIDSAKAD